MVAFRINSFGGMVPAIDDRLLAPNASAYAKNTWLRDGKLRGYRPETLVHAISLGGGTKVFRIPNNFSQTPEASFANSTWMEFTNFDTDVIRSPVVNDQYNRYYWTSDSTGPKYNTLANIQSSITAFTLGVPAPLSPATLVAVGGVSTTLSTRAYLFTWVSAYGEEGPPSAPSTVTTGPIDASWNLVLPAVGSQATGRNLTLRRVYRTITSDAGVATYFLVAELPIATAAYSDILSDSTISLNSQLESTTWAPPSSSMEGFVQMPNGIIAGWAGSDIYFCEPYRPHAWPAQYALSVDSPVVGMGVFGQALVVCTTGHPTLISGVHPSQMAQSTYATPEPCLSRSSIVSTPEGVVYASQNGLVMANAGGVANLTKNIITEEQWINDVNPFVIRAARHRSAYVAARSDGGDGFVMDGGLMGFSWLNNGSDNNITFLNDMWSGETFQIYGGDVYWFDPPDISSEDSYLWRSKIFRLPYPENLGVAKVVFTVPAGSPSLIAETIGTVQTLSANQYGLFRVYADGVLKFCKELRTSGVIFKLPSGFKATEWQFEIEGRVEVTTVEIASHARELRETP